jgi:hypothetical protein
MIYRNDMGNQQEMDINLDHQDTQKSVQRREEWRVVSQIITEC